MPQPRRERIASKVVNTGLFVNLLLAITKLTVGIIGHSRALLADGINSTSDVAYYIAVKCFTHLANKPADDEHPYGHHQMESIASVVIGAFVITTAVAIFWESINVLYNLWDNGVDKNYLGLGFFSLCTACGTIIIKILLYFYTKKAAERTANAALMALAYDHRNDIFSSAGAAIGIALSWFHFPWGDPLAGACVALIILRTGITIIRESSNELMDTLPGDDLEKQVHSLTASVSGVKMVEYIRSHRFGPYFVVNITIGVDGALSVTDGDIIATEVERKLIDEIELLKTIYVHVHPATDN